MKVLLLNPLSQYSQWENDIIAKQPSCGLLYLASYLRKFGHEVSLFERKFFIGFKKTNKASINSADKMLYEYLKDIKPDLVGITATTSQIMDAYRVAKVIKSFNPAIKVILGGHHGSAEPETTLRQCRYIDAICIGEGEDTILEFAKGYALKDIKGIYFHDDAEIMLNEKRPVIQNIDNIPFPAWDLLNKDFYFSLSSTTVKGLLRRGTTVFTQRGCPYSCFFCQNPMFRNLNSGKYVRQHSTSYVEAEIHYLIDKYKINAIFFADPIFNIDKMQTLEICNMLIKNKFYKRIVFEINLRPDLVDEEILCILKEAGCTHIIYGIESGSSDALQRMNKNYTVQDSINAINLTKKYGITCIANFIIGSPGETEADFISTIEFLRKTKPDWVTRNKFYPLPGTFFYNQMIRESKIKRPENWDELYDRYVLDNFTFADICPKHFEHLRLVMDRRRVVPTNYLFKIKMNLKSQPIYAIRQFLLMVGHIISLYLPRKLRKKIKNLMEVFRVKSKYVYE